MPKVSWKFLLGLQSYMCLNIIIGCTHDVTWHSQSVVVPECRHATFSEVATATPFG